jgi:hypothetical protein
MILIKYLSYICFFKEQRTILGSKDNYIITLLNFKRSKLDIDDSIDVQNYIESNNLKLHHRMFFICIEKKNKTLIGKAKLSDKTKKIYEEIKSFGKWEDSSSDTSDKDIGKTCFLFIFIS